jgi:aspartate-semialdehyde dehydrogenase
MNHRVAILGATGLVGRSMLALLEERGFPADEPVLLASDKDGRRVLPYRGRSLPVQAVSEAGFRDVEVALFASSNDVSTAWAGPAQALGARVVDNSSAFRYHDDVPLVVPEINGDLLDRRPMLVANPNCSAIAIVLALAPLQRAVGIERVVISTYQSVSGGGSDALDDLERGIRDGLDGAPPPRSGGAPPFAFNVIPHIDRFEDNGYAREEMKIIWETRKILGVPDLPVTATAVRVPVRVGHCAAINVTLARAVTLTRRGACGARRRVSRCATIPHAGATRRRSRRRAETRSWSDARAAMCHIRGGSSSSSPRTTCGRGRRSMRSRSPSGCAG